jgi:hypothetical protein
MQPDQHSKVRRFNPDGNGLVERSDGRWVTYEDHLRALQHYEESGPFLSVVREKLLGDGLVDRFGSAARVAIGKVRDEYRGEFEEDCEVEALERTWIEFIDEALPPEEGDGVGAGEGQQGSGVDHPVSLTASVDSATTSTPHCISCGWTPDTPKRCPLCTFPLTTSTQQGGDAADARESPSPGGRAVTEGELIDGMTRGRVGQTLRLWYRDGRSGLVEPVSVDVARNKITFSYNREDRQITADGYPGERIAAVALVDTDPPPDRRVLGAHVTNLSRLSSLKRWR